MGAKSFQIRLCQNPQCGLRYPWVKGQPSGDRCPSCLGATKSVLEAELPQEAFSSGSVEPEYGRTAVLLDNIRSALNVGSILRSAEGFGFRQVHLCGITPGPENAGVKKTALGADQWVTWTVHKNAVQAAQRLKTEGYFILALETHKDAIPLPLLDASSIVNKRILLIVGNEVSGVDPGLLELADRIVCLPMHGRKRSLNVAVAFGAAALQISSAFGNPDSDHAPNVVDGRVHR